MNKFKNKYTCTFGTLALRNYIWFFLSANKYLIDSDLGLPSAWAFKFFSVLTKITGSIYK